MPAQSALLKPIACLMLSLLGVVNWMSFVSAAAYEISHTDRPSGAGPSDKIHAKHGFVHYSVDPNTGPQRTGTLTVAGRTFTVNQAQTPCTFSLMPPSSSFPAGGGSDSLSVTTQAGCNWLAATTDQWITFTTGSGTGNGTVDYTIGVNPTTSPTQRDHPPSRPTHTVNQSGLVASSGLDTVGLYNPTGGPSVFFLRNTNTTGIGDVSFAFGPDSSGWKSVVGDWNNDGVDTIGLFNPVTSAFFLRNSNSTGIADVAFAYGPAQALFTPLAGDWNGDGVDTIGLYNPSLGTFFLRDSNSPGNADLSFAYGPGGLGWKPLVGDWDGDGIDTMGLYNPATGAFFLRNSNLTGIADVSFEYGPGGAGLLPLAGDWNGDGTDTIGLYNPATGAFFLRNSNSTGVADIAFAYGPGAAGLVPLVGDWDDL